MREQAGFSYVIVLFLVATVSLLSVRALENTLTKERREKEAELLWRGMAYREAIRSYYEHSPGTDKSYPEELQDLLFDSRLVRSSRPLRKLYSEPLSGREWGVMRNREGYVIGVYARSNETPIKRAGFPKELQGFATAHSYADWKFMYEPKQMTNPVPATGVDDKVPSDAIPR
jgi:hypothetical protein